MDTSGGYIEHAFVAEFYDFVIPYRIRQDVNFFAEMAQLRGGPVLEIGCGTGRVLIPTAKAGIEIVGLDVSPSMLSVCQKNLSLQPLEIQSNVMGLVNADMRRFDLEQKFNLITIPFHPFHHLLTVEDQISCLTNVHHHLYEGGTLVFDVPNPALSYLVEERYLSEFEEEPLIIMPDGRKVIRRYRIKTRDLFKQIVDAEIIYYITHADGRKERLVQRVLLRYLFEPEVRHLLARCGFEVEHVYADYNRTPFGTIYPGELIIVARKL